MLGKKITDGGDDWAKIEADLNKIWKKAGSDGKKMAEFEHLQFLVHAFSGVKTGNSKLPASQKHTAGKPVSNNLTAWVEKLKLAYKTSGSRKRKAIP